MTKGAKLAEVLRRLRLRAARNGIDNFEPIMWRISEIMVGGLYVVKIRNARRSPKRAAYWKAYNDALEEAALIGRAPDEKRKPTRNEMAERRRQGWNCGVHWVIKRMRKMPSFGEVRS